MGWARGQATLLPEESVTPVPSLYRSVPAFVRLALDAVAAFEGCVQARDGVFEHQFSPHMRCPNQMIAASTRCLGNGAARNR